MSARGIFQRGGIVARGGHSRPRGSLVTLANQRGKTGYTITEKSQAIPKEETEKKAKPLHVGTEASCPLA